MTTLIFTLRGLDGEVIPNTEFKIIAGYPDDAFDPDLEIPSSQTFTTDGLGQATVELAAVNLPYYVSKATNSIDDYIAFKLYVPESAVPLSAEFLYVDLGTHLHTLADKSMYTFIEAKVAVFNAVEQTVTLAAGVAASASAASTSASAASVSAAAALVSENAAEAAQTAAEAAAVAAEAALTSRALITGDSAQTFLVGLAVDPNHAVRKSQFDAKTGQATETTAGIMEVATLAETNTGVSDAVVVTPNKLMASNYTPAGCVMSFAGTAAPTGWLECDGNAISRTTYSALFAAIGTTYGIGDGSTTFNLPDLRGEFIRGWDHGRGVDTGRSLGSAQAGSIEAHVHSTSVNTTSMVGDAQSTPNYAGYNGITGEDTGSYGGTETRPRNIALMFIIKI